MKERPILFQGAMVRSVLADTKTQTRRVMARQKQHDFTDYTLFGQRGHPDDEAAGRGGWGEPWVAIEHAPDWPDGKDDQCRCPYASHRGDRLWVRETWGYRGSMWTTERPNEQELYIRYRADDPQPELARSITCVNHEHDANLRKHRPRRDDESYDDFIDYLNRYWAQWRPSMFMPRWASRILLEVTGVRVERLQAISEADALAEGIEQLADGGFGLAGGAHYHAADPRQSYFSLWEVINGPGSVEADPWVWAVAFRRVQP